MTDLDLTKVPAEMLIAELKRRMHDFMEACARALVAGRLAEPGPNYQVAEVSEELPSEAQEEGELLQGEVIPPRFSKAAAGGLAVPNRDPNRPLSAHLQKVRELPKQMDPGKKAAMWAAVDRDMAAGHAGAVAELREAGDDNGAAYLEELPGLLAQRSMSAPSISQIVAINKRNAQDAFIQPILPPNLKTMVQAPVITEIAWFDDPSVVSLSIETLIINTAPPRPGIPPTSPADVASRVAALCKTLQQVISSAATDGFTSHLPRPVLRVNSSDMSLVMLLEPVVIWRLLFHLAPRLPYVHVADNLRNLINQAIRATVAEDQQVFLAGGADTMANLFRGAMTDRLLVWGNAAQDSGRPKIAQAIKRQIRIFNADMQERGLPSESDAEKRMKTPHDVRGLWGTTQETIGAAVGRRATLRMPGESTAAGESTTEESEPE